MVITRRQKWLLIGLQTLSSGALAAWILVRLDSLFEPTSVFVALAIIVVGDIAGALVMQRLAPTSITVRAGESEQWIGWAESDFGPAGAGRVSLRGGERWKAEYRGERTIRAGDPVRVVSRTGLTLRVEPLDGASGAR